MEPIFTLPYSEYLVIEELGKRLKKSEGYAIYVPTSRQQKGVDFVIHNTKTNKFARVQVKGSRSYSSEGMNYLWFGNFVDRYEKGNADFYMLFGLYQVFQNGKKGVRAGKFWKPLVLCFSEAEMFAFLQSVKTKREGKKDGFFGFGFDEAAKEVTCTRGPKGLKVTKHLLDKQTRVIRKFLS